MELYIGMEEGTAECRRSNQALECHPMIIVREHKEATENTVSSKLQLYCSLEADTHNFSNRQAH